MAFAITPPYDVYQDTDGKPLEDAYIYIGVAGLNPETNLITPYWDLGDGDRVEAEQPIRTIGGFPALNGSPGRLYVEEGDYSILVRDKKLALVYSTLHVLYASVSLVTPPTFEDNVADMVANESLNVGAWVSTEGYYTQGGVGRADYLIIALGDMPRAFVLHADHTLSNGLIAMIVLENEAQIPAEQCGVTYGGPGVIETDELQAAVNLGASIQATLGDPDSSFEVMVNGRVRIGDTLDNNNRAWFTGISQIRSRIIWAGGYSTKTLIASGASTWGGFSRIGLVGYDHDAGEGPLTNGCQHLVSYTFIDFMHTYDDVHLIGGREDQIILDTGTGITGLTNLMMTNIFTSLSGNGYMIKLLEGSGGKKPISIKGLTANNSSSEAHNSGGIVDCSALTSGIMVDVTGARIEFNDATTKTDFALFNMGGSGTLATAESLVSLNGVGAYLTDALITQSVVRRESTNCCAYSEIGCNIDIPRVYDAGISEQITPVIDNAGVMSVGTDESQLTLGRVNILSSNYADRIGANSTIYTHGTLVLCDDHVADYLILSDEMDDGIYGFASTGYTNVGRIDYAAGSSTGTATTSPVRMLPGTHVRILGAGTAGADLDTKILSVDSSNVVTFADACVTTVVNVTMQRIGGRSVWGFLGYRENLPSNPPFWSYGTCVYVRSKGAWATWDGFRWMYSSELAVSTANRPTYANSLYNVGLSCFDTTLQKPIWWSGTSWKDATGAVV